MPVTTAPSLANCSSGGMSPARATASGSARWSSQLSIGSSGLPSASTGTRLNIWAVTLMPATRLVTATAGLAISSRVALAIAT